MSYFSDLCQYYIEKSGLNVHRISLRSSLDRTMLQHMVKGTKVPSDDFFKRFLDYLMINPDERQDLLDAYHRERLGPMRYQRRKKISQLFSWFHGFIEDTYEHNFHYHYKLAEQIERSRVMMIDHEKHLHEAISYIIDYLFDGVGDYRLFMNCVRFNDEILYKLMRQDQDKIERSEIYEFMAIIPEDDQNDDLDENIDRLAYTLPFSFIYKGHYQIYTFPHHMTFEDQNLLLYPYFLMTPEHLLLFNANHHGMLIHDQELVTHYRAELTRLKENYSPLFSARDPNMHYDIDFPTFWQDRTLVYTMNKKLCFQHRALETSRAFVDDDAYTFMRDVQMPSSQSEHSHQIFTQEAIDDFLEDYLTSCPREGSLTPEAFVEQQIATMKSEGHMHLLKPAIQLPLDGLRMELWEPDLIIFDYGNYKNVAMRYDQGPGMYIRNSTLLAAFQDYFSSLDDTIYSEEESEQIVRTQLMAALQKEAL